MVISVSVAPSSTGFALHGGGEFCQRGSIGAREKGGTKVNDATVFQDGPLGLRTSSSRLVHFLGHVLSI